MKLVNLTSHDVNVFNEAGDSLLHSFPSAGEARVAVTSEPLEPIQTDTLSVPVMERQFGDVEGLPAPAKDTLYIVSSLVMAQVPLRDDVLAPDTGPGSVIRDKDGRIVGVRRLTRDA